MPGRPLVPVAAALGDAKRLAGVAAGVERAALRDLGVPARVDLEEAAVDRTARLRVAVIAPGSPEDSAIAIAAAMRGLGEADLPGEVPKLRKREGVPGTVAAAATRRTTCADAAVTRRRACRNCKEGDQRRRPDEDEPSHPHPHAIDGMTRWAFIVHGLLRGPELSCSCGELRDASVRHRRPDRDDHAEPARGAEHDRAADARRGRGGGPPRRSATPRSR